LSAAQGTAAAAISSVTAPGSGQLLLAAGKQRVLLQAQVQMSAMQQQQQGLQFQRAFMQPATC
jgi:hypothetical protein